MIRTRALGAIVTVLLGTAVLPAATLPADRIPSATAAAHPTFDQQSFWRTTKVYCDTCHFGPKAKAKLNLQALDFANLEDNGATWEKVLRKLRNREMPPAGMPRPEPRPMRRSSTLSRANATASREVEPNPGRAHASSAQPHGIRECGARSPGARDRRRRAAAGRDIGYGFDNIGDVLPVSPLLLERYLSAARKDQPHRRRRHDDAASPTRPTTFLAGSCRTTVWAKPRRSARAAAPSIRHFPGRRRVRDFGRAADGARRRDSGPRARAPARSQARRSKAAAASPLPQRARGRSCTARSAARCASRRSACR